jgi:hypothetical protein
MTFWAVHEEVDRQTKGLRRQNNKRAMMMVAVVVVKEEKVVLLLRWRVVLSNTAKVKLFKFRKSECMRKKRGRGRHNKV